LQKYKYIYGDLNRIESPSSRYPREYQKFLEPKCQRKGSNWHQLIQAKTTAPRTSLLIFYLAFSKWSKKNVSKNRWFTCSKKGCVNLLYMAQGSRKMPIFLVYCVKYIFPKNIRVLILLDLGYGIGSCATTHNCVIGYCVILKVLRNTPPQCHFMRASSHFSKEILG
jgi:hypothetical protein